jgi:hypothetical protein
MNPKLGVHLGNNIYKIRLAIASKGKGKSGGARVLSYVFIQGGQIFLLSIFNKSERENIPDKEIKDLLRRFKESNHF